MNAALQHESLTRSVEDYLKAIYRLSPQGRAASTSEIANRLELSPASVSGMVKRLSEQGLLEHVPYKGVQLTEDGRRAALRMLRRHRLIEAYLVAFLGYTWDTVHDEAERLEHAVSDLLVERMAAVLGNPSVDPHGDPIPTPDGDIQEIASIPLSEVPSGSTVEIRQVDESQPERLRYIASLGLRPGVRVAIADRQPFQGPITIEVGGETHVIGHELGQVVRVARGEDCMSASTPPIDTLAGWRYPRTQPSLPESHATVRVPRSAPFWRKALAFAGPGYMVAVGYMDPGNWATDLAGGARFGYALLSVVLVSNLMAILLQALALKLGIVTGRDLAQACRDHYSRPVSFVLWVLCEIAIAACDLAEVIGAAIALNLLFGIPLIWGVVLTAFDVLLILLLQNKGFRWLEALVIALIASIAVCFGVELALAQPVLADVARGLVPTTRIISDPAMLYIAIGILGATVMPHNLYLHSSIVQTRRVGADAESKREAIRFATLDSTVALLFAFFINAAILILAAATFHSSGHQSVADIGDAYHLLSPLLGTTAGEHAVRSGPAGRGTELDHHRHAGRPDRDGGLSRHPPAALAAPADHPPDRDRAGCDRHGALR